MVEAKEGGELTREEVTIIKGALDLSHKTSKDCMQPLSKVIMVDLNKPLTRFQLNEVMSRLIRMNE